MNTKIKYFIFRALVLFVFLPGLASSNFLTAQPLNGNYTVGGLNPNFQTISDAIGELSQKGIDGPVVINFRDGVYQEQLDIPFISGSSATNTITFQSESLDNTKVTLLFDPQGGNQDETYSIRISDLSNVVFQYLTIKNTSSYGSAVEFANSNNIKFTHNIFEGLLNNDLTLIYSEQEEFKKVLISNNEFRNSSQGIYLSMVNPSNGSLEGEYSVTVSGNEFKDQSNSSINLNSLDSVLLESNYLSNSLSLSNTGIYLYNINDSSSVRNNKIINPAGGTGIYLDYSMMTKVFNNYISLGGDSNAIGIEVYGSSSVDIIYNTIDIHNTDAIYGKCLSISDGNSIRVLNNILANGGGGYAIYNYYSNISQSDYNDLYSTGDYLCSMYETNYANLSEWQQSDGSPDLNSFGLNPVFAGIDDYHISCSDLNGNALPIDYISTDIEGKTRHADNPDIGVCEFNLKSIDISILGMSKPELPINQGNNEVEINLRNLGQNTINSIDIRLVLNGSSSNYTWNGVLESLSNIKFSLGEQSFRRGENTLKVWVVGTNSGADENHSNDTLQLDLYTPFSGIYTIGGFSPDFTTIGGAVEALEASSIVAPVTFNIRDGIYNEQIILGRIAGVSKINTITFKSESEDSSRVSIEYLSTVATPEEDIPNDDNPPMLRGMTQGITEGNFTILLSGTSYIHFERLTFKSKGDQFGRIVDIRDSSHHNIFNACVFEGVLVNEPSPEHGLVYSGNYADNHNSFTNNLFYKGSSGLNLTGAWRMANGEGGLYKDWEAPEIGTVILNNSFKDQFASAIYLANQDSLAVAQNTINTTSVFNDFSAIRGNLLKNSSEIIKNRISLINGGYGIWLSNNYDGGGVADYSLAGLRSYSLNNVVAVVNNFIIISGNSKGIGVFLDQVDNHSVLYNSINIRSRNRLSTGLLVESSSSIIYQNNIFSNSGGGFAVSVESPWSIEEADYNNYFSNGRSIAKWGETVCDSLSALRSANSQDINSLSVNPFFYKPSDLHVSQIMLDSKAFIIAGINDDIDGETRDQSKPDIGADEFTPANVDAAIVKLSRPSTPFNSGIQDVEVKFKNFGKVSIQSLKVNWMFNGIVQQSLTWNGSIGTGGEGSFIVGTSNFENYPSVSKLKVWLSEPNGLFDGNPNNDTLEIAIFPSLSGEYTIGGSSPDFVKIGDAIDFVANYGITGNVTFKIRPGTYNEQLLLPNIKGASTDKYITFIPENQENKDVVIAFDPSSNELENFVVQLANNANTVFRGITFENNSQFKGRVVELIGNNQNVSFINCSFNGLLEASSSYDASLVFSENSVANSIQFTGNTFLNGNKAVDFNGRSDSYSKNISIKSNAFINQYNYAIRISYINNLSLEKNQVNKNTNNSYYNAFNINDAREGVSITANTIRIINGGTGLSLNSLEADLVQGGLIANNFINIDGSSINGISTSYSKNLNILFNTIRINGSDKNSTRAINIGYGCKNIVVNNNILYAADKGYPLFIYNSSYINECDYNDIFSGNSFIAYLGSEYNTIVDWQKATGFDTHSLSVLPRLVSDTSFHTTEVLLNGSAKPYASVTMDLDDQPRNPVKPDIGADEFDVSLIDAELMRMVSPISPVKAGKHPLLLEVKNSGIDPLTSLTIEWSVNQVQKQPIGWTGTIASGKFEVIKTDSLEFLPNQQYNIKLWIKNDPNPANDTLHLSLTTALEGIFTIGGVDPNFNTISDAVQRLMDAGISADVRFDVRNGVYNEQIVINSIIGTEKGYRVEFTSESKDSTKTEIVFNPDINNYVINLNNVKNISFSNLSLKNLNPDYGRIIALSGLCDSIYFKNNIFVGSQTANSSSSNSLIFSENSTINGIHIINNLFNNGAYGVLLGGNSSAKSEDILIESNRFENQYGTAISIQNGVTPRILMNEINSNSDSYSYNAIILTGCVSGADIISNKILINRGSCINLSFNNTNYSYGRIFNNFLRSKQGTGINVYYSSYYRIYSNNILTGVEGNGGTPISISYSVYNLNLGNNILYNAGGGNVISSYYATSITSSNYNDLYTTGSSLVYYGTSYQNLAQWQASRSFDKNSISCNPLFLSSDNLHVQQFFLKGAGTSISEITTDIDGEIRGSKPDIGADEFELTQVDAGISSISNFSAGANPLNVFLRNYGKNPLTSATIGWSINGILQSNINWSGNIESSDSIDIILGTQLFESGVAYTLKSWSSLPNGVNDPINSNDTVRVSNRFASLSGSYTIGGISPDYPTFTAAVNDLKTYGVSQQVIFNVRDGSYNEQVEIPQISGATTSESIIFQSESNDSTKVSLEFSANSSLNYTLRLNKAKGITFRKIGIKSLNSSYGRVVDIRESSDLDFSNCSIEGISTTSYSENLSLFYSYYTLVNSIKIQNCNLSNGSYGIYFPSNDLSVDFEIKENRFANQYYSSIYLSSLSKVSITGNSITTNSAYSGYNGIYLSSCLSGILISKNKIADSNIGNGINIQNCNTNSSKNLEVSNNFIQVGGSSSTAGIFIQNSNGVSCYYNNLNITGNIASSKALYAYYSTNLIIQNNNLVNLAGGYCLYKYGNDLIITSDYNNFFTSGVNLGYWNSNIFSLSSWKSITSNDSHSISINPGYKSASDLHVTELSLIKKGLNIPGIQDDVDNDPRPLNGTTIGADEIVPSGNDAGILSVLPVKSGDSMFSAILINYGKDTLKSATIGWIFNSINEEPVSWVGKVATGDTVKVNLGVKNFIKGQKYSALIWSELPNGENDLNIKNDTLKVPSYYSSLSGVYTIGKTASDFASFQESANALLSYGVFDSVEFRIKTNIYNEQLSLKQFQGPSGLNTVKYISETGNPQDVSLVFASTSSSNNYTLQLDNVKGITFNGVTIKANGASYGRAIELKNICENLLFTNNTISGSLVTTTSSNHALVYSENGILSNSSFISNQFSNGSFGMNLNPLKGSSSIAVSNNSFTNQYYCGSTFSNILRLNFSENLVQTGNSYSGYKGVDINYCQKSLTVNRNKIIIPLGEYGVRIYSCSFDNDNKSFLTNNFISLKGDYYTTGISLSSVINLAVIHNSVYSNGNGNDCSCFTTISCSNLHNNNNSFYNSGKGYAVRYYSIADFVDSDYNNIFSENGIPIFTDKLYTSLEEFKATNTIESHSVSSNPIYYSETDLHTNAINLNNKGKYISLVPNDIDGELRSTLHPDIGADEFNPMQLDGGVISISTDSLINVGNNQIYGEIKNFGSDTIKTININWSLDGLAYETFSWNGVLLPSEVKKVILGTKNFSFKNEHSLVAWTSMPNGQNDLYPKNDTARVDGLFTALDGTYTIGGTSPDFSSFSDAANYLVRGGIKNKVTFNVREGVYTEQIVLPYIKGSLNSQGIVFKSESGDSTKVTLSYSANSSNNFTIQLKNAVNTTIKGITIRANNTSFGHAIELSNTRNISIQNCILLGNVTTTTSNSMSLIYSTNSSDTATVIRYCKFLNGSYGVYLEGNYSKNSFTTTIQSNLFENQFEAAIYIRYNQASRLVTNSIKSYATNVKNGINLNSCSKVYIAENIIDLDNNGYGIYMDNCDSDGLNKSSIINNFISVNGLTEVYGLYLNNSRFVNIFFNSVSLNSDNVNSSSFYSNSDSDLNLKNNIFANFGKGYALNVRTTSAISSSDYNNIYSTGILGYWGQNITSLDSWKAITSLEGHSLSVNPYFISPIDLHVREITLNEAGINIPDVTTDIDGDIRSTLHPDIGADEFKLEFNDDAGIAAIIGPVVPFKPGLNNVEVVLRNFGKKDLTSASINWKINNAAQPIFTWVGLIKPGEKDTISIGSYNFLGKVKYSIESWSSQPNGEVDPFNINDTVRISNLYSAYGGIYTIGGVNPDFNTFQSAVDALKIGGIYETVTFNVRNGGYNESVIISEIPGITNDKGLLFQSENGDSALVVLSYNATSINNSTLLVKDIQNITYKNITLKSLSSNYGRIVVLTNTSNITFKGCILEGIYTNSTSDNQNLISSTESKSLSFINNNFRYGSTAIKITNNDIITSSGNSIANNYFKDQSANAIYGYKQNAIKIIGNSIESSKNSVVALYLADSENDVNIEKNRIDLTNGIIGISLSSFKGRSGAQGNITNNFITVNGNSDVKGISVSYPRYLNVIFNNINILSNSSLSYAFSLYYGEEVDVLNNNFVNNGNGNSLYFVNSNNYIASNYNNLFSRSGLAVNDGSKAISFSDWIIGKYDKQSVSVNPFYRTNSDLHVQQISLDGKGTPVSGLTKDIDEELRSLTNPDIGADEFTPITKDDAGIIAFSDLELPLLPGNKNISVVVKNYGVDTLKSARIAWQINNEPITLYNWSGVISPGKIDTVSIGIYNFLHSTKYSLKSWTEQPNSTNDICAFNDTTSVDNIYAGYEGVFTIGGNNPDFKTFNEAINTLKIAGINKTVIFNVRNGLYDEQIAIPKIKGTSNQSRIIFTSESGDSSKVILSYNSSSSNNYIVRFDNSEYTTIEGITIKATSSYYSRCIEFINGNSNILLQSNAFSGSTYTSSYDLYQRYIISSGTSIDNLEIVNNKFDNGSYAFFYYGNSSQCDSVIIDKNIINNSFYGGIFINNGNRIIVSNNLITSNTNGDSFFGISLNRCNGDNSIYSNKIVTNKGNGIYLGSINGDNANYCSVYNNFISINGTYASNGIYVEQSNYLGLYYNSINILGTSVNSNAINLISGTNNRIINNILCNKGNGVVLRINPDVQFESDYNDLYAAGSILAKYNQDYSSLSEWRTSTSKDLHSLAVDPQFVTSNDLHSKELLLNGNAKAIVGITVDIDGDIRNLSTPDIGADELIVPSKVDAGIVAITEPVKPFEEGTTSIYAVIKNFGSDTLKSASINWFVNGNIQNNFSWHGKLQSGGQDTVKIGNYYIESAIPYHVKLWSTLPNSIADTVNSNDTLSIYNIYAALDGEYTIGGLYPDFIDFKGATDALEYGGVIDSVSFIIRNGTYNESVKIKEVVGASARNTITFQSESLTNNSVILTNAGNSTNNYTLCLDGSDFIRFNSITIKNTSTNYGRVVELKNGATNNRFYQNIISTAKASSYSSNCINIYSQNANDYSNSFVDNTIENGYIGISMNGESSNLLQAIIIQGNTFENQYQGGVSLRYVNAPQIIKNNISTSSNLNSSFGINLVYCQNKFILSKNRINIQNGGYGLKIESCEGTVANRGLTSNNFITIGGKDVAYGIHLSNCNLQNIYYNSVNITSTDVVDGRALYCTSGANNQLYNNILCNHGGGYAIYINNPSSIGISNYNNLFTTGTNLGYWNKNCNDLAAWRLESDKDNRSFSIEPLFESVTDLHVKEIFLKNSGTPVNEVTDDIDNEFRDSDNPDIGADEFYVPAKNDAGIIAITNPAIPFRKGNSSVTAVLRNFGYTTLANVDIEWRVNENSQVKYHWNGNLQPGKSDTINIGLFDFTDGQEYEIIAWTKDPNNVTDIINVNDTARVTKLYTALEGIYTIGGVTPNYKSINNAVYFLNHGGVVGPVTFNIRNGIYKENVVIHQIYGASELNKVLFISEARDSSAVVLKDSTSGFVVQLDDADYVTLSHITINRFKNSGNVIELKNGATNNSINNCLLKNDYSSFGNRVISLSNHLNSNNQFSNNCIIGGEHGINMTGSLKYIQMGNIVENNLFNDQKNYALFLQYQNSPVISKNSISSTTKVALFKGCYLENCYGNLKVTKNKILLEGDGVGIIIEDFSGSTSQQGLVANNFISIGGTSQSHGISITNNSYLNVANNSINVFNTSPNAGALSFNSGDNNYLINNLLVNTGSGYSISLKNTTGIKNLDYNNFYTTGNVLAILGQTKFSDLESFKLQTNFDVHSISVEPLFNSNTDLHVSQIALDSAGVKLPYIADDIDGELRNIKKPDIGADEFRNTTHDLSITSIAQNSGCLLHNDEPISIIIKNFGAYNENGFNVSYRIDDKEPVIETINQNIPAGRAISYTFNKKADLSSIRGYLVKTSVQLGNDDRQKNDSSSIVIYNMPRLDIKLTRDTSICQGSSITLTASGADSYFWNTGDKTSSIKVIPTGITQYIVTASTIFNNCIDIDTVTVRVQEIPQKPVITASGPINFCNGSSVVLSSSYSKNNIWSNGEKTPSITVRHTGWFRVTYKDSVGCSSTSNPISPIEEKAATITPASITVCTNDSVLIKVDNAASYLWSTGQTKPSIKVSPATTSVITVTGITPLGCPYSLSSNVNIRPAKVPGAVSNMIPADVSTGLSFPVELSWLPADDASYYDLYIWNEKQARPVKPYVSNINSIRYTFDPKNKSWYGATYKWQVVAKYYECESTPSPIQRFSLRYLPDLLINAIESPISAFTGQKIEVTWEVKNQGLGSTIDQEWTDEISYSLDTIWDGFHILGRLPNMTYLEPNQSYLKRSSFTLPKYKDGLFNVSSLTNYDTTLLESNSKNNFGWNKTPMWVKLAPPPDLYVNEVITPLDFFSEDTINISWTVTNKGKWFTDVKEWTDRVYISQDFDKARKYPIGDFKHKSDTLKPGQSYTQSGDVIIPEGIFGKYYIYVETDVNNRVYEHAYDGNNVSQSDSINVILRPPADLRVDKVEIPDSITNVESAIIKWKVSNIGNSSPRDRKWTDAVYLSKEPKFNPEKSLRFLFEKEVNPFIPVGYSYSKIGSVDIPHFIEPGNYYVYVKTDFYNQVFEYEFEENNVLRSDTTMKVSIAPWPDLRVNVFEHPDSIGAGETMQVMYTVKNLGDVPAKGEWTDKIFIARNRPYEGQGYLLKTVQRLKSLNKDSTYSVITDVTIPCCFANGSNSYLIKVYTDASITVYEHSDEGNNIHIDTIFIKPSDLAVTTHSFPDVFYSGSYLDVNFVIKNMGTASTPDDEWIDKVEVLDSNYVSLTTKPSENEILRGGLIKPGTTYNYQKSILIPDGIFGKHYLRLRTDKRNDNNERVTSNNVKIVPVNIILREPTDLVVNTYTIPQTGIAGQPVTIQWNVKNVGPGPTLARRWVDRIYLSEDDYIEHNDILLGSFSRSGGLVSGESYNRIEKVFLPITSIGNYKVIIMTDFPEDVREKPLGEEYEYKAEDNNTVNSLITISLPAPSDLIVTHVSTPVKATAGELVTIGWTIKNIGPNKAKGFLTDMVYFSRDTVWDIDDVFFGELQSNIDLTPGNERTFSLTTELTGTSVGGYYVLVRTDNKNNIYEVNDQNNTLPSTDTLDVEVPLLPLYTHVSRNLVNDLGIYYKLEIPDSLVDETLMITIKGDSIFGDNYLYLSYDKVPDRSDFEFASRKPFSGNQELIVPSLKKGTYYLLVYGSKTNGTVQNISLYAGIINFQIRSIQANEGGNSGQITVDLYGAKFTNDMVVKLQSASTSIIADTLIYVDPTKVFVTFNLQNVPLGLYDVMATNTKGETATLKDGFTVVETSPFGLVTSVKAPRAMLLGTIETIAVQYANDGNVDLPIPKFKFISEDGAPISFLRKDLGQRKTELELEFHEINGPQHILRPGAVNTIYIWVLAHQTGVIHFRLK
ncbi:MAG: hypothetical protein EHM93_06485 [Bacteroidales bacterium]|nr:MAG: hypothetical protein EHM93_06485 [Bacteroidales bacterium]